MIDNDLQGKSQSCLAEYHHYFKGIGKLKNYQIKLQINIEAKPVATPPRSIPYHLHDQMSRVMINQDIIEEHPINKPGLWVLNIMITPKADGSLRMTLNACNNNKAIISTNQPIPRHEDIKSKLAGCTLFS